MSLARKMIDDLSAMQHAALANPMRVGQAPPDFLQRRWQAGGRVASAVLAIDRCPCGAWRWHASMCLWAKTPAGGPDPFSREDDEPRVRRLAEILLKGVGITDSCWWWSRSRHTGHLLSHVAMPDINGAATPIAGQFIPDVPCSRRDDTIGEWFERVDAVEHGETASGG